jgi:hypothetical protein
MKVFIIFAAIFSLLIAGALVIRVAQIANRANKSINKWLRFEP